MATSSIFTDFTIKTKKDAEAFVKALEESASQEKQACYSRERVMLLTKHDEIKALMMKRNVHK